MPASAGDDAFRCPAIHAPAQFARLDIAYPSQPLAVKDEHFVFRCGDEVDARLGSGQREKVLRGKERHERHGRVCRDERDRILQRRRRLVVTFESRNMLDRRCEEGPPAEAFPVAAGRGQIMVSLRCDPVKLLARPYESAQAPALPSEEPAMTMRRPASSRTSIRVIAPSSWARDSGCRESCAAPESEDVAILPSPEHQ